MRTDDAEGAGGETAAGTARGEGPARASVPIRTCIGCRDRDARDAMVRIVLDPDRPARAVVDGTRAAPGRGAWLHDAPECLAQAERRRALRRALRAQGEVAADEIRTWMEHRRGAPQDAAHSPH